MAILNKLISAAVMTIVLTGCYSDFEPDIDSTPVICINANAKVGEVLKIFATRTWRWKQCGFLSSYYPQPGDKIKIMAHSPVYGDAEGEVTVPFPVEINEVESLVSDLDVCQEGNTVLYRANVSLGIRFADPLDITNYYLFESNLNTHESSFHDTRVVFDYNSEPLFTEHVSSLESVISETSGYTVFSDRMVSGKRYPLHIRLNEIEYRVSSENGFA